MRSRRKAKASGTVSVTELPEAIKPFLNVLAEMLADSVLRARAPHNPTPRPNEAGNLNCASTDLECSNETTSK